MPLFAQVLFYITLPLVLAPSEQPAWPIVAKCEFNPWAADNIIFEFKCPPTIHGEKRTIKDLFRPYDSGEMETPWPRSHTPSRTQHERSKGIISQSETMSIGLKLSHLAGWLYGW